METIRKVYGPVIEALHEVIKWIGIVGASILVPSVSGWAIFKFAKWLINKMHHK